MDEGTDQETDGFLFQHLVFNRKGIVITRVKTHASSPSTSGKTYEKRAAPKKRFVIKKSTNQ